VFTVTLLSLIAFKFGNNFLKLKVKEQFTFTINRAVMESTIREYTGYDHLMFIHYSILTLNL